MRAAAPGLPARIDGAPSCHGSGRSGMPASRLPIAREHQMRQYQVAVLVGSLRRDSINRKLAAAMTRLAPSSLAFTSVGLEELPMYNADLEADRPAGVHR